jgi:hypothetical protein
MEDSQMTNSYQEDDWGEEMKDDDGWGEVDT